ncbi:M28 family metallopeptidase [Marinoscillum furvescens]|uniref:Peptidase M28-like protein n=1 Tax=Marinoscillum furvescens DSM 4134 TaxID=1122208 RepID=A0A3D9L6B3_MARFU|nr:M28 family metallopeptidase [Marinoscillum furvescens]REE00518.1 peptidase M28-like protein [Marinoscillum furvescens DSM 4134]
MKKVIIAALMMSCGVAWAQKDKKLVDKTVSKQRMEAHLKFLASDALRGRDTPSQGLEVAAEYLRTQLEYYGVKPFPEYPDYFQPVPFKKYYKPERGALTGTADTFQIEKDFLLLKGSNLNWTGEVVVLPYATQEELEEADVAGKLVVCTAGDGTDESVRAWYALAKEKRLWAQDAGAAGIIELYQSPQIPWPLLVKYLSGDKVMLDEGEDEDEFLTIWMSNAERKGSKAFSTGDTVTLEIAGSKVEKFNGHNIVGYVEGSDSELKSQYVAFTAHYDHVGVGAPDSTGDNIYNGARDNAVGTVTVLEAAKNLTTKPTKRSSLFVLFTAEEKGLLGSKYFVDNSPLPLNEIAFCFNSDNGGYNNTSMATVIGLDRTTAEDLLIKAIETYGLTPGDDANYKDQNLFDRSDNVSFASKGIPAPSFGMGVDAFDEDITRTYHQPADEFETLDMDYLYTFYRAYVLAGRLIGNMKETPFWVEGDKYYEAGKALYEK